MATGKIFMNKLIFPPQTLRFLFAAKWESCRGIYGLLNDIAKTWGKESFWQWYRFKSVDILSWLEQAAIDLCLNTHLSEWCNEDNCLWLRWPTSWALSEQRPQVNMNYEALMQVCLLVDCSTNESIAHAFKLCFHNVIIRHMLKCSALQQRTWKHAAMAKRKQILHLRRQSFTARSGCPQLSFQTLVERISAEGKIIGLGKGN